MLLELLQVPSRDRGVKLRHIVIFPSRSKHSTCENENSRATNKAII